MPTEPSKGAMPTDDAALKAAREISHYVSGQNDAAFHAANSLCEQHEGKLKTAKQNCEAIAAIIRKHLAQRDAEVIKALEAVANSSHGTSGRLLVDNDTEEQVRSTLRLLKEE